MKYGDPKNGKIEIKAIVAGNQSLSNLYRKTVATACRNALRDIMPHCPFETR